jgi:hypothetical protein
LLSDLAIYVGAAGLGLGGVGGGRTGGGFRPVSEGA